LPLSFADLGDLGSVTASLVVTANGSHISEAGTSQGIGNQSDLELLIWLRRRASAVLTSGLTARVENYKVPSNALLAILSREGVPHLSGAGSERVLFLPQEVDGYSASVSLLQSMGHQKIHTEFGPRGFVELVDPGNAMGLISSGAEQGPAIAASELGLRIARQISFGDLHVAVVTGRGSSGFNRN
jgi:hypothetical protein